MNSGLLRFQQTFTHTDLLQAVWPLGEDGACIPRYGFQFVNQTTLQGRADDVTTRSGIFSKLGEIIYGKIFRVERKTVPVFYFCRHCGLLLWFW